MVGPLGFEPRIACAPGMYLIHGTDDGPRFLSATFGSLRGFQYVYELKSSGVASRP